MFTKLYDEVYDFVDMNIQELKKNTRLIFNNKTLMFITFVLFIIFLYLTYYIYNKYIKEYIYKNHVLNKELINKDDENKNDNNIVIILFKTEWCPYCKSSMEEWNKFKKHIKNINNTNTKQVTLNVVDCDENKLLADKYEIEAYPTVKMFYKGDIYDYDAEINKDSLLKFIESTVTLE